MRSYIRNEGGATRAGENFHTGKDRERTGFSCVCVSCSQSLVVSSRLIFAATDEENLASRLYWLLKQLRFLFKSLLQSLHKKEFVSRVNGVYHLMTRKSSLSILKTTVKSG